MAFTITKFDEWCPNCESENEFRSDGHKVYICSTKRPSAEKAVSEAQTNNDMYEASEYTPDYGARERALQLLVDAIVTITLSKEDYRAITALIDKELKMYEAQLPHFASKAILVKALTRCLKKTEAVRGLRERWINNKR